MRSDCYHAELISVAPAGGKGINADGGIRTHMVWQFSEVLISRFSIWTEEVIIT